PLLGPPLPTGGAALPMSRVDASGAQRPVALARAHERRQDSAVDLRVLPAGPPLPAPCIFALPPRKVRFPEREGLPGEAVARVRCHRLTARVARRRSPRAARSRSACPRRGVRRPAGRTGSARRPPG